MLSPITVAASNVLTIEIHNFMCLTAQQDLLEGSPDCRAVPPAISELMLAFLGANLDTPRDFLQQGRLLAADIGQLALQPPRLLADEHRVHHHLASDGPANANDPLRYI